MKRHILIITAMTVLLSACGGGEKKEGVAGKKEELAKLKAERSETEKKIKALEIEITKMDPNKAAEAKVKPVSIDTLNAETFRHYVELQGTVDAKNNVLVTPKSGGVVVAMNVKEGDYVKAGGIIGKIDNSILTESIEELKTQMSLANTIYEKQKNLWDQKIGTEIQYLQAKNNKEALERKMSTLNAQLSQTNIVSPMAGVVDMVNVKVGEMASPGVGVVRIVNLSNLKVIAKVSDTYAASVKKGDEVIVKFPDLKKEYKARITFVSTAVDPLSRTFTIEANLPTSKDIKPNMMAQVQINDAISKNALAIDQNYVQSTEKGNVVYVAVTEGNKKVAKAKEVKTGLSYNGKVEILSGLTAGDQLITLGYQEVSDGQPISY
ncbi:efflux RND transporter periplasmic adaptor subunit [Dyadobacter chenhuakuii]|jgi:membrane fusion protein (multidrug efflux system)|uniref:Efflux RND transporter periplasmic adaptor subunit n=1 Tax=Dyadobacter chenhuakuii TaxID=2909339 RepID=A0A9X1QEF7_9BACT|nr:efflux RND transporter periplasmic adaptor subunit [Dyadobacter chenhuakuii]MCF2496133.1 efflux RND transporter periplasmic adaptor subunit [Dyadobacter chenhuakuii]MCF2499566.1 efflux RND transporter periplasmic adaptor subunit [Dyadobacter chenhuakuii]USJ30197.1 efflux RND transporter periplasmic adaptor subunit [Dyadobacter chenhuakuii]